MDAQEQNIHSLGQSSSAQQTTDPVVIAVGSFLIGFIIGSGRLPTFSRSLFRVGESLGNLALLNFSKSIQEKNIDIFHQIRGTR